MGHFVEYDPSDFGLTRGDDPLLKKGGPRRSAPFIRGPIPYSWLATASRLPGAGFSLAMSCWYLVGRFGPVYRVGIASLARHLGLGTRTTQRAFQVVERAGLVTVGREPGHKLTVAISPQYSAVTAYPLPLYGPIPWEWWLGAAKLPRPSLQVSAICWLMAGWERRLGEPLSPTFALSSSGWEEDFGVTRSAFSRALNYLSGAGLVRVDRRPGLASTVTILGGGIPSA